MPQDDSDSSDADSSVYTTTNVLLGYASKEPTEDIFSQLGGRPVRLGPYCHFRMLILTSLSDMAKLKVRFFVCPGALQDLQQHDDPPSPTLR